MVKPRIPRKTTSSPGTSQDPSSFAKNNEDDDGAGFNLSNHFLIAMPSMPEDPVFGGSVVYLCEHNAGGALGVIINKPTDMSIDTLLERIDLSLEITPNGTPLDPKPVMFGGPVQVERGFVLHTPVSSFSSMMTVSDDIVLTTSKDVLEAVAHGAGPARILITLGCAGWSPGQLEQEIANNGWLTVRADPRIVFDLPIEQRFDAAMRLLGIDPMMLSGVAGHA
ncbi:MAG TPA: YqgE/AlgH family protein [Burkholderiaceae bacterium]|jgi:putative transcriptional regulator